MSNYVGPGKELLSSELPTVRDILRFGVLKRELSDHLEGEAEGQREVH